MDENANYLPSPEEIERACLEIQSRWTHSDRMNRLGRVAAPALDFNPAVVRQGAMIALNLKLQDRRQSRGGRR